MRASIFASVLAAAAVCGGLLLAVWLVLRPAGAALRSAEFSSATLTPDADGLDDVLRIRYELARPALVSIFLLDAAGTRYTFRSASQRSSGSHAVLFSGIVDGFALAGETVSAEILARVLPAGDYTWVVAAAAAGGDSERRGILSILSAPAPLPDEESRFLEEIHPCPAPAARGGADDDRQLRPRDHVNLHRRRIQHRDSWPRSRG